MIEIIGYALATVAGLSLGLTGSGGAILSVPILVYLLHVDPVAATGYSLFIVGVTSLVGGVQNFFNKTVNLKIAFIFGIPSVISVYLARAFFLPSIPDELLSAFGFTVTKSIGLMILFAFVMILAALSMIHDRELSDSNLYSSDVIRHLMLFFQGIGVGVIAGLVGAGGGFLIVPTLFLLAQLPIKKAIGTSLFIVTIQSLSGFWGELQTNAAIDWELLLIFTGLSIIGILMGVLLAKKVDDVKLKKGFGWFVLVMGVFILTKELFF